jgi:hypothetical protein
MTADKEKDITQFYLSFLILYCKVRAPILSPLTGVEASYEVALKVDSGMR